jgi:hypothetical protein
MSIGGVAVSQLLNDEHRHRRTERRFAYPFIAALFVSLAAIEWLGALTHAPRRPVLFSLLAVCAVAAAWWHRSRLRREAGLRKQYGVAIEKTFAEHLAELQQRGGRVFHDVHIGGMNLDHVVISAHGIYVVEARTWHKPWDTAAIQIYGEHSIRVDVAPDSNPARQVGRAVLLLEQFFLEAMGKSPPVRGVVVFPRAWATQSSAHGVACLSDPKSLPSFIKRQPQVLDARTVKMAALNLSRYLRLPVPRLLPQVTSR